MPEPVQERPFSIDAVWLDRASFRDVGLEAVMRLEPNSGSDPAPVQNVDYELEVEAVVKPPEQNDSRWRGLVRLTARIKPQAQPTYELHCAYVAQCSAAPNPPIPFDRFLETNATAVLVPYLRERMSSMTQASRFPVFLLPPVNTLQFASDAQPPAESEPEL